MIDTGIVAVVSVYQIMGLYRPAYTGLLIVLSAPGVHASKHGLLIKQQACQLHQTTIHNGSHSDRDDGAIDDYTWINGVRRGNFRLHPKGPAGLSKGCITLLHPTDFQALRRALLNTNTILARGTNLRAYGTIRVKINGKKGCNVPG